MNLQPLTCKEFVELVTDYLEGSLSPEDKTRFEAHLAVCDGCETYLEQIKETIRLTGKLSEEQITPQAQEKLLNIFRDWKQPGS
ncbi:MAG TPA: zf-HC2 domain-containing protein [Anaerolineales bacterium]|nr:zf-HC2 domain-containing protein [Anaerolineales bacterium]